MRILGRIFAAILFVLIIMFIFDIVVGTIGLVVHLLFVAALVVGLVWLAGKLGLVLF